MSLEIEAKAKKTYEISPFYEEEIRRIQKKHDEFKITTQEASDALDALRNKYERWVPLEEAQKQIEKLTKHSEWVHEQWTKTILNSGKEEKKIIDQIKAILLEPDPYGEKYKQKLWRLKEMLQ